MLYGPEPSALQKRFKITRCVYKKSDQAGSSSSIRWFDVRYRQPGAAPVRCPQQAAVSRSEGEVGTGLGAHGAPRPCSPFSFSEPVIPRPSTPVTP